MRLYFTDHLGNLNKLMIYHYTFHPNEMSILLLSLHAVRMLDDSEKIKFISGLENKNMFHAVYTCKAHDFKGLKTIEAYEERINWIFDEAFWDMGKSVSEFDAIFECYDASNYFSIYLSSKKTQYHVIEKEFGYFSVSNAKGLEKTWRRIHNKSDHYFHLASQFNTVDEDNEYAVIVTADHARPAVKRKNPPVFFEYYQLVKTLDAAYKKRIADFFMEVSVLPKIDSSKKYAVLLTNSRAFYTGGKCGFDQQVLFYQLICDYYLPEDRTLVIKPHPNADIRENEVHSYFDGAEYASPQYPADFLSYLPDFKIDVVASIASTAVQVFENDVDVRFIGPKYLQFYKYIHQVWAAYSFLEYLGADLVYQYGFEHEQLKIFVKYAFGRRLPAPIPYETGLSKGILLLNAEKTTEEAWQEMQSQNEALCVVLCFLEESCLGNVDPSKLLKLRIDKKLIQEGGADAEAEAVYIYNHEKLDIQNPLFSYQDSRRLNYTGIALYTELQKPIDEGGIQLVVLDVDGTLTDGGITHLNGGEEGKTFHVKDGFILHNLPRLNIRVVFLTGRASTLVQKRAEELNVLDVIQGVHDKYAVLSQYLQEHHILPAQTAYIGDDINDYKAMLLCHFKAAPCDAADEIKEICDYVSPLPGGKGAVRNCIEMMLKNDGKWDAFLQLFIN